MKYKVRLSNLCCMIMALSIMLSISSINTFAANVLVNITSPSENCSYAVGDQVKLSAVVIGKRHKTTKFFVKTSSDAKGYIYGNNPKAGSKPTDTWDTTGSEPGTYIVYAVVYDVKGKELARDSKTIKLNAVEIDKEIKLSGYISTDFQFSSEAAPYIKSGFIVELIPQTSDEEGILRAETDENGYFEIENIPQIDEGYTMEIKKTNYLTRYIDNLVLTEDTELSSQDSPIILWAGDLVQDDAINMEDIVELTKYINSFRGDNKFIEDYDLNRDNAINIMDIMIVSSHFLNIPNDYEEL